MLIVVMMRKWSDDSRLYSVLDSMVISGEDVCCSVLFGLLVGVFSVMWSELLMISAIGCPLWSSMYDCQRVECALTSPVRTECGMFVMCRMQCCMPVSVILQCLACGGVGGGGVGWWLGPRSGRMRWCHVCVCCESGLFVWMTGQGIRVLCLPDTCPS